MTSTSKITERHHWNQEDEQMLVDALVSLVGSRYHFPSGNFRKHYSLQVVDYFHARKPDTKIEKYSIECKTKTLKRQYMAIKEMKGPTGNGFGWNEEKQCVEMHRDTFENYLLSHPNAKGLLNKPFPYMDQLSIVFNSDASDGHSLFASNDVHEATPLRVVHEAKIEDVAELGSEDAVGEDDNFPTPSSTPSLSRQNNHIQNNHIQNNHIQNNQPNGMKRKRSNIDDILQKAVDVQRAALEQTLALQQEWAYSMERKQMEVMQRVDQLVGFTENQKRLICDELCLNRDKVTYFLNMKPEWHESFCADLILKINARSPR